MVWPIEKNLRADSDCGKAEACRESGPLQAEGVKKSPNKKEHIQE